MVFNYRPTKRAKKMATSDLPDFLTFPCDDLSNSNIGCFRSNVRRFVSKHAQGAPFPSILTPVQAWQILFRIGDPPSGGSDCFQSIVFLDIVEEDVPRSRSVYCDECRVIGWSNHPVCAKRYHFIIRSGTPCEGYQKPCSRCGNLLHLLDLGCKYCFFEISTEELEDWVYLQLEDTSHLLHGVIHSNGYGHLIRVNGREGGSMLLSGCDIMSFWDRLCTSLAARKVSVMDVSKKYGLEYRLLHSIVKGHSWYGDWGYEFGSGSFALTQESYLKAVNSLSNLQLSSFLFQGRRPRSQLQSVILFYQSLSDLQLLTLRDLFSFLLRLIHEIHLSSRNAGSTNTANILCTWTRKDIEHVQRDLIKVLSVVSGDSGWVPSHSLKGALCKSASLELLDYCLKHLGGMVAGNDMVVQTRCNPISNVVEFRLISRASLSNPNLLPPNEPTEEHLLRDLKYLFDSIVNPSTMTHYHPEATRKLVADSSAKLLDCKKFLKDYNNPNSPISNNPFTIPLWCEMQLSDTPKPPPEFILLPHTATIHDLKLQSTLAFREVYPIFKNFQAEELPEYGPVPDSMLVKFLMGSGGRVRLRGRSPFLQGHSRFGMERGTEGWTVNCVCGARDDDGERMVACDTCGVWVHTRCIGIGKMEAVLSKFVCVSCSEDLGVVVSGNCRNEMGVNESGMSLTFGIR